MPQNIDLPKPVMRPIAPTGPKKLTILQLIKLEFTLRDIYNNTIGNMNITSWKIKLGGFLLALAPLAESLPESWHWVSGACLSIGGLLLAAGRQNNVSSEEAGAK